MKHNYSLRFGGTDWNLFTDLTQSLENTYEVRLAFRLLLQNKTNKR